MWYAVKRFGIPKKRDDSTQVEAALVSASEVRDHRRVKLAGSPMRWHKSIQAVHYKSSDVQFVEAALQYFEPMVSRNTGKLLS